MLRRMPPRELLTDLLRDVSRSFYLTLRVLPGAVRPQLSLAYLLARATDTVADTAALPVESRLEALRALKSRLDGSIREPLCLRAVVANMADATSVPTLAERELVHRLDELLAQLRQFSEADQQRMRDVLATIISGQELDLQRFGATHGERLIALATKAEFDDYTYRVAGCVGEFWTKICRTHLFPRAELNDAWLLERGVRFGRGLQMVNILRDLPADLRAGRCYVPEKELAAHQLTPAQLLDPASAGRFRPLYHRLLDEAQGHLAAGWEYTNALPRGCGRVRLACAWPVLIGAHTLQRLRRANVLDVSTRVKIGRADVRRWMWRTVVRYPWRPAWERLFQEATA